MDDVIQELERQKKELEKQMDALMEEGHQRNSEYFQSKENNNTEIASRSAHEMIRINNEIIKLHHMINEIDRKIKISIPPAKTGELVDLRPAGNRLQFAIYLHDQPMEIGKIEYRDYHCSEYLGDVGYAIGEEYRNNGYATEALALLSEKLFEEGIPDFWISARSDNMSSIKVIEKNQGTLLKEDKDRKLYIVPTKIRTLKNTSEPKSK